MDRFRERGGRPDQAPGDGAAFGGRLLAMQEGCITMAEGPANGQISGRLPASGRRGTHSKGWVYREPALRQAGESTRARGGSLRQFFAATAGCYSYIHVLLLGLLR